MKEQNKSCLGVFSFFAGFLLSLIALAVGWIGWSFRIGAISGGITFAVFFLISGGLLATISDPSWFTTTLPGLLGTVYSILPDFLPGPIDDTAVFIAGVLGSFGLMLRKIPEMPKWTVFPLLAAGVYTLVGAIIPGPVDELFVYLITGGVSGVGIIQHQRAIQSKALPEDAVIEGEFTEEKI